MRIRDIQGRVYNYPNNNRIVSIHNKGEFEGQIMKVGRGTKKLKGTKTIFYMRPGNKVQTFYRSSNDQRQKIKIVAKCTKKAED